jgi:hypothetical protein
MINLRSHSKTLSVQMKNFDKLTENEAITVLFTSLRCENTGQVEGLLCAEATLVSKIVMHNYRNTIIGSKHVRI